MPIGAAQYLKLPCWMASVSAGGAAVLTLAKPACSKGIGER